LKAGVFRDDTDTDRGGKASNFTGIYLSVEKDTFMMRLPNEQKAKNMIKGGMTLLLLNSFIRQQKKNCTGVEISTCSKGQIIQFSSHGYLTVTSASV